MATLDPAVLERELDALRRQRLETSQRVRAARQPPVVHASQTRNAAGETPGARPPLGHGHSFGPSERGFGGAPPSRGEGLRGPGPRDGPLFGRLGGPPGSQRGSGPADGFFGARPDGPGSRGGGGGSRFDGRGTRGYGESGRDRDRDRNAPGSPSAAAAAAAPTRRRAVMSVVVRDKESGATEEGERTWGGEERRSREGEEERRERGGPGGAGERSSGRWHDHDPRDRLAGHRDDEEDACRDGYRNHHAGTNRRDNHHGPGPMQDAGGEGRGTKRPAEDGEAPLPSHSGASAPAAAAAAAAAADPDSRKRARRLLGRALLGTLQKFRQEDAQFQASDAAARRAELARKAEEKAAAESERLRRAAAEDRARQRQQELSVLMDLNLATDIKVLELLYAKKLARRRALAAFLRADGVPPSGGRGKGGGSEPTFTAAGSEGRAPPVHWLPARHCEATLAIKERQARELKEWEETVLAELEQEKEGLRQRAQARREGIAERRQRAEAARAAGGRAEAAGGAEEEEEEAEDHEALEAVELDVHPDDPAGEQEPGAEAGVEEMMEAEVEVDAEMEAGEPERHREEAEAGGPGAQDAAGGKEGEEEAKGEEEGSDGAR